MSEKITVYGFAESTYVRTVRMVLAEKGLERWLVTRRPILRTINWLRTRRGKPPLVIAPRSTRRD